MTKCRTSGVIQLWPNNNPWRCCAVLMLFLNHTTTESDRNFFDITKRRGRFKGESGSVILLVKIVYCTDYVFKKLRGIAAELLWSSEPVAVSASHCLHRACKKMHNFDCRVDFLTLHSASIREKKTRHGRSSASPRSIQTPAPALAFRWVAWKPAGCLRVCGVSRACIIVFAGTVSLVANEATRRVAPYVIHFPDGARHRVRTRINARTNLEFSILHWKLLSTLVHH